jgi:hypothetical protein
VTSEIGLVDEVGDLVGRQLVGEVDQDAWDGGARDASHDGDVAWVEAFGVVDFYPLRAAFCRGYDSNEGSAEA